MYKLQKLISLILTLLLITVLVSCESSTKMPDKFKNTTTMSDSIYTQDSLYFSTQIMSLIEKNESAFYPKSYSFTLNVYIDTVLYSPDYLKAAFFVITKKPNSVVLGMEDPDGHHYDAKCFLAQRDSVAGYWRLKWFRIMNINRYSEYDEISNQIRKRYFEDLKKIDNEDGNSRYKYNLDDVRFWSSPAWSESAQMLERNYSGDG